MIPASVSKRVARDDTGRGGYFHRTGGMFRLCSIHAAQRQMTSVHLVIGQRKLRVQMSSAFRQPLVAQSPMAEPAFHDPMRMFVLDTNAGLDVFRVVVDCIIQMDFARQSAQAGPLRDVPVCTDGLHALTLVHTQLACIGESVYLVVLHQGMGLGDSMGLGRSPHNYRRSPRAVCVHSKVSLHTKVTLIARFGVRSRIQHIAANHLRIARARAVLGETRRGYQRGIDQRAFSEQEPLGRLSGVGSVEPIRVKSVLPEQMPESQQDAHPVGQAMHAVWPGEQAMQWDVEKDFFHRPILRPSH